MSIVLVLVIIVLIWFLKDIFIGKPDSEVSKVKKDKLYYDSYYFGGFDDISAKTSNLVSLIFNDDNLSFTFYKNSNILNVKKIKYTDIIKVRFMNEISISKEISLGKMVCFGWLSLAMKEEKRDITEYVVIDIKNEEEISSIILEGMFHSNDLILKEVKNRIVNI